MNRRLLHLAVILCTALSIHAQDAKNHNFEVAKNLDLFNAVYKNLDMIYVDTLNANEVIGNGIKAMLNALDPYTEFYSENETKNLKTMLTGKYAGIGAIIKYHKKLKRVVIDEPYAGQPAAIAGLKPGDIILSIDDTIMTDKNVTYVSNHLRGEAGTTFLLKVLRPSTNKKLSFKITRQTIKMPEITYFGILDNNIGYINLNQFTEGCAKNMRRAFVDLKQRGAQSLILDLRGNGGGSLSEAIDIINIWVPKGTTLVETKGKIKRANDEYKTRLEPIDTIMPIVVLTNGETASASEITSGSIQDLDRGIILGTRTYGKGLVQATVDLPYNSNLKLTTSKYYIPSGRCIQAINYKHSGGGYTEHVPDSLTHVFHTRNGREVRDGGGIKPDVEVKADTISNLTAHITGQDMYYLRDVDSTEVFFDYIVNYCNKHEKMAQPAMFHLTDAEYDDFKQQVIKSGFTYDLGSKKQMDNLEKIAKFEGYYDDAKEEFEALKSKLTHNLEKDLERNKEQIKRSLELKIVAYYYYQAGALQAALQYDKQVKAAIKLLNNPNEYNKLLIPTKNK